MEIIEGFANLPYTPVVDLINPEVILKIIDVDSEKIIYFGILVAAGRLPDINEYYYKKYCLKKRPYLGPTSCDNELAFLMAN